MNLDTGNDGSKLVSKTVVKKSKSNIKLMATIDYLYTLSLSIPYINLASRKTKEFADLCSKNLIKLKKYKYTICRNCKYILIPKKTSQSMFVRKENGFGFEIICKRCWYSTFIVLRGQ